MTRETARLQAWHSRAVHHGKRLRDAGLDLALVSLGGLARWEGVPEPHWDAFADVVRDAYSAVSL